MLTLPAPACSAEGVYGDSGGEWVDERSEPRPCTSRGIVRLQAEEAYLDLHRQHALPVHIFRLGGIYGPGRSVFEAMKKRELAPSQERRGQQKFISRCHVLDICQVLAGSMACPSPGEVFNVVDDDPAPRAQVMAEAARLLLSDDAISSSGSSSTGANSSGAGAGGRQVGDAPSGGGAGTGGRQMGDALPQGRQRTGLEEKRVRNAKVLEQLGMGLRYPSYREGLQAIHAGHIEPFLPGDLEWLLQG